MIDAIKLIALFAMGVLVDWVMIDSAISNLKVFRQIPADYEYRRYLGPRLIAIFLGCLLIVYGVNSIGPSDFDIALGIAAVALIVLPSIVTPIIWWKRSTPYIESNDTDPTSNAGCLNRVDIILGLGAVVLGALVALGAI